MKLRLDVYDVIFTFEITDWAMDIDEDNYWLGGWRHINYSLESSYINYRQTDDEIFTTGELIDLKEELEKLLKGEIKENCSFSYIEPDFTFSLYPATRLYSDPEGITYSKGYEDRPLFMELRIHFWCKEGGLGQNIFQMSFCENEIRAFVIYLKYIMGEISEENEDYLRFLHAGVFVAE